MFEGSKANRTFMRLHARQRRLNPAVALMAAFVMNGIGIGTAFARLPEVKRTLALEADVFGFALLGMGLGTVVSMAVAARMCPRLGTDVVIRTGVGLLAVGVILVGVAPNALVLFAALVGVGLGNGTLDVSMSAQGLSQASRSGTVRLSFLYGLYNVGELAGAAVGSFAALLRVHPAWHLGVIGAVLIGGIAPLLRLLMRDRMRTDRNRRAEGLTRAGIVMAAVVLILVVVQGVLPAWGGVYLLEVLDADPVFGALSFAVYSGSMGISRLLGDRVMEARGTKSAVVTAPAIAAASIVTAAIVESPLIVLVCYGLVGAGLACVGPVIYTIAGRVVGQTVAGGIGSVATAGQLGDMIGPPIVGVAATSLTLSGAFIVVGMTILGMAAMSRMSVLSYTDRHGYR